jgi:3'-5' exoribonuclease
MKNKFASQLKIGDTVDDLFILAEKTRGVKRDGAAYLNLTIADKSGRIKCVVWDNADDLSALCAAGDFVRIQGSVSEYKGNPQLIVKRIEKYSADIDPADFLPSTQRDTEQMFKRLLAITKTIRTDCLRELLEHFWQDPVFVRAFKKAPAAKMMHHAYIGGLLEHTLSLAILAERVGDHYEGIDRDLLLAGCILHDIGKIREFEYETRIDYTDEGRLVNHIVIGMGMVEEKMAAIKDFPPKMALMLKHLIISHHGCREFGSPEPPKTLEAVMLNYLDEIDSKINGIRDFMRSQDPDADWTGFYAPLERFFYKAAPGGAGTSQE